VRLRALPMHHAAARRRAWGCLLISLQHALRPSDAAGLKSAARATLRARAVAASDR